MSRVDLARYRMEKAGEILKDAEDAIQRGRLMLSVNRAYYPMFTAARALLALEEKDSSKHSGVISLFNQWIVKPGYCSREISRFLVKAKDLREDADYGDFDTTYDRKPCQRSSTFCEKRPYRLRRLLSGVSKKCQGQVAYF